MEKKFFRDRYSVISFFTILLIMIIIYRLFTLQIVNGQFYNKESEKKLLRVNAITASRGDITDRFGRMLANNRAGFNVEIIKVKVDDEKLNQALLDIVNILEKNNDTFKDNLPIDDSFAFTFNTEDEKLLWMEKYKISKDSSGKQALVELRKKYKVNSEIKDNDARKIIALRYEMSEHGYQSFKRTVLAFDISKESVNEIEERHSAFPGVNVVVTPIRNYPNGIIASHIIGYISKINENELKKYSQLAKEAKLSTEYSANDVVGKIGIEGYSEIYLKGKDGKKYVESDTSGRLSRTYEDQNPTSGGKIELTVDLKVQKAAEQALEANINKIRQGGFGEKYDAKGGAVIAVDVNTGGILALASYPNFDPSVFSRGITSKEWNKLNTDRLKPLYNRAIAGTYAPGSTFKMVTAIAALEEGKVKPKELIEDTGEFQYGYKPKCWLWTKSHQTHGLVDVSEAIKVSCNVYFYEAGRRLGLDRIADYASKFGLDKKTNIEIAGETASLVAGKEKIKRNGEPWYPGDAWQAAIGQSDTSVTPIAMASYMSTLANGGKQYQLHLIKSQKSFDEKEIYGANNESSPIPISEIKIKPENLRAVFEGMKSVAGEQGGTAYSTFKDFPPQITIAGKTGSAQTGIAGQAANAWFVGFAPYESPKIAVVVLIENGGSGGYTAPIAKEVFAEYFGLNNEELAKEVIEENSILENPIVKQVD